MHKHTYLWQDEDGNEWESPCGDDRTRGRCTGIPECCIDYFMSAASKTYAACLAGPMDWGYRPCAECVRTGNRIEPKHCGDLKDACTCGTWANRVSLADDEDEA